MLGSDLEFLVKRAHDLTSFVVRFAELSNDFLCDVRVGGILVLGVLAPNRLDAVLGRAHGCLVRLEPKKTKTKMRE